VRPNPARNSRGLWDDDVVDVFRKKVEHREGGKAEIYSVVAQSDSPLLSVSLCFERGEVVNHWLKENPRSKDDMVVVSAYAATGTESYLSKENHAYRLDKNSYSDEWKVQLAKIQATVRR
jgi:hypothetical protein